MGVELSKYGFKPDDERDEERITNATSDIIEEAKRVGSAFSRVAHRYEVPNLWAYEIGCGTIATCGIITMLASDRAKEDGFAQSWLEGFTAIINDNITYHAGSECEFRVVVVRMKGVRGGNEKTV